MKNPESKIEYQVRSLQGRVVTSYDCPVRASKHIDENPECRLKLFECITTVREIEPIREIVVCA